MTEPTDAAPLPNRDSPPPEERDPAQHFSELFQAAGKAFRAVVSFAPAALYFWGYWPLKEFGRRLLRGGALVFFSLSFLLFVFEISLEFFGAEQVSAWLHEFQTPNARIAAHACFALAALVIVAHHWREARHANTEFTLAQTIWAMLESRSEKSETEFVKLALPLVVKAFSRFGVGHVCLWQPEGDGLSIPSGYTSPNDGRVSLTSLSHNQGIANHVFRDLLIRYVPRLAFPFNSAPLMRAFWQFRHALSFKTRVSDNALPDVDSPKLLIDKVHFPNDWWKDRVRSFVVVPLKASQGNCIGAMSIDFTRTNPLDREQLKTAASLAILIAEEIIRIRSR